MLSFHQYLNEAKGPQWKKAGPNGEKEIIFPTGRRFKIEKQLDHNERHHGEWKVMEWNKRTRDWDWHDTFSPQWYAKEKVMEIGQYDSKGKKVATYESVQEGSESWEAGYKRRVVKTTKPDHLEKGYKWRIKGKDRPEISIKLYKEKPSFDEFKKQMRRVAGHEFGG